MSLDITKLRGIGATLADTNQACGTTRLKAHKKWSSLKP